MQLITVALAAVVVAVVHLPFVSVPTTSWLAAPELAQVEIIALTPLLRKMAKP